VTGILLLLKVWSLSICWIVVGVILANLLNTLGGDVGAKEFYQTIWLAVMSYLGAVLFKLAFGYPGSTCATNVKPE